MQTYSWQGNRDAARARLKELLAKYGNSIPDQLPSPFETQRMEMQGGFKQRLQRDYNAAREQALHPPADPLPNASAMAANPMEPSDLGMAPTAPLKLRSL